MRDEDDLRAAFRTLERHAPDPDSVLRAVRTHTSGPASRSRISAARRISAAGRARRRQPAGLRLLAPLAAATAVIAVIAASVAVTAGGQGDRTAGAGQAGPAKAGPAKTGPGRPASISDRERSRLNAEVIDDFLPATGAEFTTGAQLVGTIDALESTTTASCMARSGFRIPRTTAAPAAAQFFDNTQFPDLARISRTGLAPVVAAGGPPGPPAAGRRAFSAALSRCHDAAARPFLPLQRAGGHLAARWLAIVTRIQSSAKVRATLPGLRSCAERYGWPANPYGPPASSVGSFSDFADWVFGHIDGAGTRGAGMATLTGLGRHWARIFVTCARPTITVQQRLQSARRAVFIQQHYGQAQALEAQAQKVIGKALRLDGMAAAG
jgi:hypothetical protein